MINTFIIAALILDSTEFGNPILVSIRISFVGWTTVGLLLSIQLTLNLQESKRLWINERINDFLDSTLQEFWVILVH